MQLDPRARDAAEPAAEGLEDNGPPAEHGCAVALVERLVEKAREEAFDRDVAAPDETHQTADRALRSERDERTEIAIAERSHGPPRQQLRDRLGEVVRFLTGC